MKKTYVFLLFCLVTFVAYAGEVSSVFNSGEPLTEIGLNDIKSAVNNNHSRISQPVITYYSVETLSTTEQQVNLDTSVVHAFCAIGGIYYRGNSTGNSGNSRWCTVSQNADGTWHIEARYALDDVLRCSVNCMDM